jgi:hypothetical protein
MKDDQKIENNNAPSSEFADRVLKVFEAIALQGPILLGDLAESVRIPKVSAWRAVRALKEKGWVRSRVSDQALEASNYLDRILSRAQLSALEADEVEAAISHFEKLGPFEIRVGIFSFPGKFEILDGSRRREPMQLEQSLAFDCAPTAALLACSRLEVLRHLDIFCRTATKAEKDYIMSGDKLKDVEGLAVDLVVWRPDEIGFAVPVKFSTGAVGSVEVLAKANRGSIRTMLLDAANFARDWSIGSLQSFNGSKVASESLYSEVANTLRGGALHS